jgi:aminopeptidase N
MTMVERVCRCRSGLDGFTLAGATPHYPPDLRLEPVSMHLALRVLPDERTLVGTNRIEVTARAAGALTLLLDAVDFEDVEVSDAAGAALTSIYDGRAIRVTWDQPWKAGERRSLVVAYRVHDPVSGVLFSAPTAESPDAPTFAATDNETERARHWLPCIDLPAVRCHLTIELTVAAGLTALANGRLKGDVDHGDGTHTTTWVLDEVRCPSYLICFAVGDFTRLDDGEFEGMPVAAFCTREFGTENLEHSLGRTRTMLGWMTRRLGRAFPFSKYFQFMVPDIGGAMENISLVSWDDRFVLDDATRAEAGRLLDLINVHEMAHSYFGDLVVVREFAHAWLKESWATYLEIVWFEESVSRSEALYEWYTCATAYFAEADTAYQRPLVTREFNSSWQMYDRHLYPGGACRLHTLRKLVGDEVFWQATSTYLDRFAHQTVETGDLRRVFEEVSGRSLVRFFEQWFETAGYPAVKATLLRDANERTWRLTLEQTQFDAAGSRRPFALRIPLVWVDRQGEHRQVIEMDQPRLVITMPMPNPLHAFSVDPEGETLMKLSFDPGDDLLKASLTSSSVIERIRAGVTLCASGRRSGLDSVALAWDRESFWGVRVEWARAVAGVGSLAAARVLAGLVARERDPLAMEPLFRAAGAFPTADVVEAARQRLGTNDLPPRARGAALELVGRARAAGDVPLLVAAAGSPGFQALDASGALAGLGEHRSDEVIPLLIRHTRGLEGHRRSRSAAIAALGSAAAWSSDRRLRAESSAALVDALRDSSPRLRSAAVAALGAMRAVDAIPALEAWERRATSQDAVSVRRVIEGLRAGTDTRVGDLEKQVQELRDKLRRVEQDVDLSRSTRARP